MTCRMENGITYLQVYNAENRMEGVGVMSGDCDEPGTELSQVWEFVYDGNGSKVKQIYTNSSGTLTTYYYMGGLYEVENDGTTDTIQQYYSISGVNVGMASDGEMSYFLTDHLGSIVGVTDDTGALTSETRYTPFGEVRADVGTISETDYGYTNQESIPDLGLMDYNARMYDASLGRFVQPDTIVSEPGSTQGWNRYAYSNNNPIRYSDPSGHSAWQGEGGSETAEQIAYDNKRLEHLNCQAGNENYCSNAELFVKHYEKPIFGVYFSYAGQAGVGLEGGIGFELGIVIDIFEGDIFLTETVEPYAYLGTPTGIDAQIGAGIFDTRGIPHDYGDISGLLEGDEIDFGVDVSGDVIGKMGLSLSESFDLESDGSFKYFPGNGYVRTNQGGISTGLNAIPNGIEGGMNVGYGYSRVIKKWNLW